MPEASDTLINSQNQRISTLERELAETRHESKTRKLANRKLAEQLATVTKERDDHAAAAAVLTRERDEARVKLTAAPDEKDAKIADLELRLRTRTHQDRFNELARAAGCDETALAAAWDLCGYSPESDEPDEGALNEAIGTARNRLAIAFKGPAQSGQATGTGTGTGTGTVPKKAALRNGVGGERGYSAQSAHGTLRVRKSDLRSVEFMRRNQDAIAEASKAGTLELLDG
jgi:hypothetical protein